MHGKLIYKCRLCGGLHTPINVPNTLMAMANVVVGSPLPKEWDAGTDISVLNLHSCDDGRTGLSDLVGAE